MYYVGMDVHLNSTTMHILNGNGRRVKSLCRTIKGPWSGAVAALGALEQNFVVCFEASCGYGTLHDQIQAIERCKGVQVAHPGQLRLIFRSKRKNDRVDAARITKLLYLNEVPVVHVPNLDVRSWRRMIAFRQRCVAERVRVKNRLRALLRTYGIVKPRDVGGLWTKGGLRWLGELSWPSAMAKLECKIELGALAATEGRVKQMTRELDRLGACHPGVTLLKSINGVGPRTAEAIAAHIDDPSRFRRNKQIGAYFGLVPCQDSSGPVNRLGHITKDGPALARKLLIEAAWQGIRRDAHLRTYFDRIAGGKKDRRKIALVATAHHLLRCMLAMLKHGETWNPPGLEQAEVCGDESAAGCAGASSRPIQKTSTPGRRRQGSGSSRASKVNRTAPAQDKNRRRRAG